MFVCRPTGAADETACARKIVTRLVTRAYRRPATAADVDLLMKFYADGRKDGDFDRGIEMALARVLASPKFIYRIEAEPANAEAGRAVSHQRSRIWRRGCRSSSGARSPDDELIDAGEPGPAEGSGRARAAGPADAEGSARRGAGGQLRRPVAEPARPAERRVRCRWSIPTSTIRCVRRCGAKSSCCSTASFAKTAASSIC